MNNEHIVEARDILKHTVMSRVKDDVLLEERIEKIRRKNEEIKRRHLEVEADKQSAAKQNALVQPRAQTEDWTSDWCAPVGRRKQSERDAWPASPNHQHTQARTARRRPETSAAPKQNGRCFVFTEGDSPPPDPVYNFLADSERDTAEERRGRRGSRQAGGRGAAGRQRGSDRSHNHKEMRAGKDHAEYEAWRAERNRIDQDRINRQKTAEGLWRREWDNEKVTQVFEEDQVVGGPVSRPHLARVGSGRLGSASVETSHVGNTWSDAPARNFARSRNQRTQRHTSPDNGELVSKSPPPSRRNICKVDGTLTISISNTACPSTTTTSPLQRVRVKPPTVVGSGRVGPHHKIRTSYSSQSDDEQHSPRRRTSNGANTPSGPARNGGGQTVKFNTASLRPPLPPAALPDGQAQSRQRGDLPGNRQSRKRNMLGDYSKKEERRADSTGSSRGESEGGGDESWEDVTTSGAESTCETSEDKTPSKDSQGNPRHDSKSGWSVPAGGEGRNIVLEQARNKEAHEKTKKVATPSTNLLPVQDCSSKDQAVGSFHQTEKDLDDHCISSSSHTNIAELESDTLGSKVRGDVEVNFKEGMKNGIFERFEEGLQKVA